jgi:hypothetical protein
MTISTDTPKTIFRLRDNATYNYLADNQPLHDKLFSEWCSFSRAEWEKDHSAVLPDWLSWAEKKLSEMKSNGEL